MAGSQRNVSVKFTAEIAGFRKAMEEAAASTQKVGKAAEESSKAADTYLGRMVQSANKNRDEWEKAGATMLGFGAAAVGGLALAGKAAMSWESAWAGVTKTVDGTPAQMDELEASLRGLAKTLPATHEEIAGVAEAAGQLGVKREDVVGFTKTMIDLGESTNLSADEAATGIAQISNVMGTMARDGSKGVERFGATLVALGNAGASTEAEILDMAKRIAGAAKLVGASESDVLALSNAMASVGIEAQLGGGVISRVMQRMYADVKTGGEGLDKLAKVAGVSSKDFAKAFETDPVRAVDSIVKGLGRVKAEGGNVIDTMSDLGVKGTEETSVLLRLAGAGDLLSDSLKLGDEAWASNSALAAEAAKRYETTESKVKIAWNNIKDAAIDAGAVLLPIIAGVAETVAGMAQAFGALPAPVKGALAVLGGVAGVAALGAGAFLTLTPKILDSVQAFNKLAPAGGKARTVVANAGKAAGVAAAAYAALSVAANLAAAATDNDRAKTSIEGFNNALDGVAKNGDAAKKAIDGAFNGVTKPGSSAFTAVNDLDSALKRVFNPEVSDNMNDFWSSVTGNGATSGINVTKAALSDLDKSIASMARSGNLEDAAAGFRLVAEAAEKKKIPLGELIKLFPEYKDAITATKTANGETQVSQEALTKAMLKADPAASSASKAQEILKKSLDETGVGLGAVIEDMDKFLEQLFASGMITMSARDANAAYHDAIRGIPETLKTIADSNGAMGRTLNDAATDFDLTTAAGSAANAALQDVSRKGMAEVTAMSKEGLGLPELQQKLSDTYDDLVRGADGMGITGQAGKDLARDILGVPDGVDIYTWMDTRAKDVAKDTKKAIDDIPKVVNITIDTYKTTFEKLVGLPSSVSDGSAGQGAGVYAPGFIPKKATGGRLAGFADGGQLPTSGPGTGMTDGFLGISSAGVPLARVDAGEWIVNRNSSGRYNRELAAINAGTFPKLPGYATGGMFAAHQFGRSSSAAGGSGGVTFGDVTINDQSDPVATFHEFSRRANKLTA